MPCLSALPHTTEPWWLHAGDRLVDFELCSGGQGDGAHLLIAIYRRVAPGTELQEDAEYGLVAEHLE